MLGGFSQAADLSPTHKLSVEQGWDSALCAPEWKLGPWGSLKTQVCCHCDLSGVRFMGDEPDTNVLSWVGQSLVGEHLPSLQGALGLLKRRQDSSSFGGRHQVLDW